MQFPSEQQQQAGAAAYNRFLAEMWRAKQGEIAARARQALDELQDGEDRIKDAGELKIDFAEPPQLSLETLSSPTPVRQLFVITAPGDGVWTLSLSARLRFRGWHKVKIRVRSIKVRLEIKVRRDSPVEARLLDDSRVQADVKVDLSASNVLLRALVNLAERLIRRQVRREVDRAVGDLLPSPRNVRKILALGLASEPPAVIARPVPEARLEAAAREVSARIRERHMPWGAILSARLASPSPQAPLASHVHYGDAAIWTGHYLAAEVFRWRVTEDPEALDNLRAGVDGIEALNGLTVDKGLLSRVLVPLGSPQLEAVDFETWKAGKAERLFTADWRGQRVRSIGHITRDQYCGALLGTGLAALLLGRRGPRRRARRVALEMIDYLSASNWCPGEARTDPAQPERTSVTYALSPTQTLAILQLARRLDPDRYQAAYQDFAPAASITWLFAWLQTLDPDGSYYKFNLEHSLALLLLLDTGDDDKPLLSGAFRTVRRALRYHGNAWFNLVELAALGSHPEALSRPREEIEEEVRQQLVAWLERPAVWEPPDLANDPDLDVVTYPELSGKGTERISRQAIEVSRRASADFLWQRSPFKLRSVQAIPEEVGIQAPGVDFVLPYWLARYLGVIEGP